MLRISRKAVMRVHRITSVRLAPAGRLDRVANKLCLLLARSARGRGEIGRRTGFKIPRPQGHAGSSPAVRTILGLAALAAAAGCNRRPDDIPVAVSVIGGPVSPRLPARTAASRTLVLATAEGLVRFDAAGGIEPGLAARWIVRDDNRSYIFRLREAAWPDGTPVDADSVARTLRRAVENRRYTGVHPYLTAIDEIVAMTPQVIEVRLSSPRPDLLKLFAAPELAIPAPGTAVAGAGPFAPIEANGGAILLRPLADLGAVADDADTIPQPEDHVRLAGERAAAAILRFARRRSDLVLGGALVDWPLVALAAIPPANVRIDPAAGLFGFAVASRDGFLADAGNRAAVALAIDGPAVAATIREGWAPAESILPEQLDAAAAPAPPAWSAVPPADRIGAARQRIAAFGAPVRLRIALPDGPGATLLYDLVGSNLRRLGVDTVRVAQDAPADLRLVDAVAPYDSARWYLRGACQPCAAPVAALIAQARAAPTLAERARYLTLGDRALAADVAFLPIARPLRWSLVATRLRAFQTNARAIHPLNHLRADTN